MAMQPAAIESQPAVIEVRPVVMAMQPAIIEVRSAAIERQPAVIVVRSAILGCAVRLTLNHWPYTLVLSTDRRADMGQ
jgi:hypothetical protein